MKQTFFCAGVFGTVVLLLFSASGCVCQPGYGLCGSVMHQGVVDYVDGPTGADCGANCGPGVGGYVGGTCVPHGMNNCASCLGAIGNGVRVIGEGAFSLAASPFIVLGSLISGGPCGYETFPNCGCSNEIYYGDNCYQSHDFCDPCADSCGDSYGSPMAARSGCATCSGGYTEGVQFDGASSKPVEPTKIVPQGSIPGTPASRVHPGQTQPIKQSQGFRPVLQTGFRQPIRTTTLRPTPPRPLTIQNKNQIMALPVR